MVGGGDRKELIVDSTAAIDFDDGNHEAAVFKLAESRDRRPRGSATFRRVRIEAPCPAGVDHRLWRFAPEDSERLSAEHFGPGASVGQSTRPNSIDQTKRLFHL